jgi:hypothetical protein
MTVFETAPLEAFESWLYPRLEGFRDTRHQMGREMTVHVGEKIEPGDLVVTGFGIDAVTPDDPVIGRAIIGAPGRGKFWRSGRRHVRLPCAVPGSHVFISFVEQTSSQLTSA